VYTSMLGTIKLVVVAHSVADLVRLAGLSRGLLNLHCVAGPHSPSIQDQVGATGSGAARKALEPAIAMTRGGFQALSIQDLEMPALVAYQAALLEARRCLGD